MDPNKRAALEAAGWKVGDFGDFLGLSDAERRIVELRGELAKAIRDRRAAGGFTQAQVAKLIESSQPRFAAVESGAAGVSLDLMFKALFALGGSLGDVSGSAITVKGRSGRIVSKAAGSGRVTSKARTEGRFATKKAAVAAAKASLAVAKAGKGKTTKAARTR